MECRYRWIQSSNKEIIDATLTSGKCSCYRPRSDDDGLDEFEKFFFEHYRSYIRAKAEAVWRFLGLYVHVCRMDTLQMAYDLARMTNLR